MLFIVLIGLQGAVAHGGDPDDDEPVTVPFEDMTDEEWAARQEADQEAVAEKTALWNMYYGELHMGWQTYEARVTGFNDCFLVVKTKHAAYHKEVKGACGSTPTLPSEVAPPSQPRPPGYVMLFAECPSHHPSVTPAYQTID